MVAVAGTAGRRPPQTGSRITQATGDSPASLCRPQLAQGSIGRWLRNPLPQLRSQPTRPTFSNTYHVVRSRQYAKICRDDGEFRPGHNLRE